MPDRVGGRTSIVRSSGKIFAAFFWTFPNGFGHRESSTCCSGKVRLRAFNKKEIVTKYIDTKLNILKAPIHDVYQSDSDAIIVLIN